jgi:hypothetical protein
VRRKIYFFRTNVAACEEINHKSTNFFPLGSNRVLPGTSFDSNGTAIVTKGYILRKENFVEKSYNLYETIIGGSLSQLLYKMKHHIFLALFEPTQKDYNFGI